MSRAKVKFPIQICLAARLILTLPHMVLNYKYLRTEREKHIEKIQLNAKLSYCAHFSLDTPVRGEHQKNMKAFLFTIEYFQTLVIAATHC